jgi:hypothetical protein
VTPATWDLFRGDSGTSQYKVSVTKSTDSDRYFVSGQVCVTNGGDEATQNLKIADRVQYKIGAGPYTDLPGATQTITPEQLDPHTGPVCYQYKIYFTPVAGATYRNVAKVSITNHSGNMGEEYGPEPKYGFTLPGTPDTLINDKIHVTDTNRPSDPPWEFTNTGSVTYDETFTCDAHQGKRSNSATITETQQSDDASVTVNCYALEVKKTAQPSFTRKYTWTIKKSADESSLTLAIGETHDVNYEVTLDATYTDSGWAVGGSISVHNPAPIPATVNSVTDLISPDISATVDCGVGGWPRTLAAGDTLSCTYSVSLEGPVYSRTNTAAAKLQNYAYDSQGGETSSGTTDFSGTASVDFTNAEMTEVDKCVDVSDTYEGSLGTVCYGVDTLPKKFTYSRTVGPYEECGEFTVDNTASFVTSDTKTTGKAEWTVAIQVPCAVSASLRVIKHVVSEHGGVKTAADFTVHVMYYDTTAKEWREVQGSPQPGDETGTLYSGLDPGLLYRVSEDVPPPHYVQVSITDDCAEDGTVTLVANEEKSCTITNKDPGLVVIKQVVGGTKSASDFAITVIGENPTPATFEGSESGTYVALDEGAYSVTETPVAGYTPSYSVDCSGTIKVEEPTKTCTITNTYSEGQGTIIVEKNTVGGDDTFMFTATGGHGLPDSFPIPTSNTHGSVSFTVDAGPTYYTVSESIPPDWSLEYSRCSSTDGGQDFPPEQSFTVPAGGSVTCTFGNLRGGQPTQPPVGGDLYEPNKLVLLKPYLTLLGLLAAIAAAVAITGRRRA